MRKIFVLLTFFGLSGLCTKAQRPLTVKDLVELRQRMTGYFSSEDQHLRDSVHFFDIRLHMTEIWRKGTREYWLYVEQAAASTLEKPYRQRIYRLSLHDKHTLSSQVYELPDPLRFAGAWKDTALLRGITPDSLLAREGCALYLTRDGKGDFHGQTPGKECKSSLRGATYATSEAHIYSDRLVTWDRGWNPEDKQVWGATEGGYEFLRKNEK